MTLAPRIHAIQLSVISRLYCWAGRASLTTSRAPIREIRTHKGSEKRTVIAHLEMDKLVDDNLHAAVGGRTEQADVERQAAL